MNFFKCIAVILMCCFYTSVHASDMSVFQRDFYDRITIENADAGNIEKSNGQLRIPFSGKMASDFANRVRTLKSFSQVDKKTVLMFNDAVTDTRHFRIRNRIILDIFFDADKLVGLEKPQPVVLTKAEPIIEPQPEPEQKLKQVVNDPAPELIVEQTLPALAEATIVTISSTKPFGLTIFQRLGRLFVVTDQSDMAIPPQVSGNGAKLGWVMSEIPMSAGKAWSMPIPKGTYVRPEGRGLIWRAIISDVNPNLATVDIRRRFTDPLNPEVDILIPQSSKLLRFTDPDYGDDLAVVTVKRATSRMMIPYDFIDFEIMPAIVGTVIRPKSDGLRIVSGQQFVTVSNANGLIVSPDSQNQLWRHI